MSSVNVLDYELSPPSRYLKSFRFLLPGSRFSWWADAIGTVAHVHVYPYIRIGSFAGCAPWTSDGDNFLRVRHNEGDRACLIALGSSSYSEPVVTVDAPVDRTVGIGASGALSIRASLSPLWTRLACQWI